MLDQQSGKQEGHNLASPIGKFAQERDIRQELAVSCTIDQA